MEDNAKKCDCNDEKDLCDCTGENHSEKESEHECGCGHDHEHEHHHDHEHHHHHDGDDQHHEHHTVTLHFEDGIETECAILGIFEALERDYIALLPMGEETLLIYRYAEGDNQPDLSQIETDEEYDQVVAVFNEIFDDEDEVDNENE